MANALVRGILKLDKGPHSLQQSRLCSTVAAQRFDKSKSSINGMSSTKRSDTPKASILFGVSCPANLLYRADPEVARKKRLACCQALAVV